MFDSFVLRNIRRDWLSTIILTLFSFVICTTAYQFIRGVDRITYLSRVFFESGLNEKVFYIYQEDDVPGLMSELAVVQNLEGVKDVEQYRIGSLSSDKVSCTAVIYDTPSLKSIRYDLAKGSQPNPSGTNEILLPIEYDLIFDVGDEITMSFSNFDLVFDNLTEVRTVQIRVAGFLKDPNVLAFPTSYAKFSLGHLFTATPNTGILYNLVDIDGNKAIGELSSTLVITPEDNYSQNEINDALVDIVRSKSYVHSGEALVERYWVENDKVLFDIFADALAVTFLSLSVLLAGTYLSLISRRKEMSVWYLSGIPWRNCVQAVVFPKFFALLFGFSCAMIWLYRQIGTEINYMIDVSFRWSYVLITFGFVAAVFLVGVLPFYVSSIRKSPVELFRKD